MFREGDMVWCFLRGWGTIVLIDDSSCYPINVSFEKNNRIYCYSREGELLANDAFQRTLFFDEFVVPKSALERPKWRAKKMIKNPISSHIHYDRAKDILRRCNNDKDSRYYRYGGRGIECRLGNSIQEVILSLEKVTGYEQGLSLDRINNDGHYELGNLRWADSKTQNNNRRKFSEQARKNMSTAHLGLPSNRLNVPHTEETKTKISKSLTGLMSGEKHPMYGRIGFDNPNTRHPSYYETNMITRDNFMRYCKKTGLDINDFTQVDTDKKTNGGKILRLYFKTSEEARQSKFYKVFHEEE